MELKTLKDFEKDVLSKDMLEKYNLLSKHTLRKEAIKWIKRLEEVDDVTGKEFIMPTCNYEEYEASQVIEFIKHFFNIKEDEIK